MLSGFPLHTVLGKGWDRDNRLDPQLTKLPVTLITFIPLAMQLAPTELDCFLFSLRITVARSFLD